MSEWLVDDTGWLALTEPSGASEGQSPFDVRPSASYPLLEEAAVVLWWPPRCVFGVHSFEGKPRHAAALVERRLRGEGLIELGTKIFVPQVQAVGTLCQAFYMAVAGEEWRRMTVWEGSQAQQCLVVPMLHAALALKDSADLVLILGRTEIIVLGTVRKKAIHLNAVVLGAEEAEWIQALGNLATRLKSLLGEGEGRAPIRAMCLPWHFAEVGRSGPVPSDLREPPVLGMDRPQGISDNIASLEQLVGEFARISGIACAIRAFALSAVDPVPVRTQLTPRLPAFEQFNASADKALLSAKDFSSSQPAPAVGALPQYPEARDGRSPLNLSGFVRLGSWKSIAMSMNTGSAKTAAAVSVATPILTVATTLLLVLALAIGFERVRLGHRVHQQVQELDARARTLGATEGIASPADAAQAEAQRHAVFIETLAKAGASLDILDALMAVRGASVGAEMRILGLRLEDAPKAAAAAPAAPSPAREEAPDQGGLIVDGRFASQTVSDSRANAEFSRAMAASGYGVRPLEIKGAVASLSDSSRLFSYRVTPLPQER